MSDLPKTMEYEDDWIPPEGMGDQPEPEDEARADEAKP